MTLIRLWKFSAVVLSLLFAPQLASAQGKEFWPEVDVYVNLNEKTRLYFSAAVTNEDGERSDIDLGASIDFYVKP